ncbi:MAG: serine/threonine-protein kinase [Nannocystaceae bacterium]
MDDLPTRSDDSTRVMGGEESGQLRPRRPPARVGRYVIIDELGRGGMGVVLRAYDPRLQREVALKMLITVRVSEGAQARMVREARAMARLSHPNVVAVYDVETIDGDVVLAMELVEGQPLSVWLRDEHGWEEIVEVFAAAGRALVAAHAQGLLHRDFKPANVIVRPDGRPQVTDFGLARAALAGTSDGQPDDDEAESETRSVLEANVDTSLTVDGTVVGTPAYMAPECHSLRAQELSPAVDQYAFCVALWFALAGTRPFDHATVEEVARAKLAGPPPWPSGSRVPGRIVAALRRGLQPQPQDRWSSMAELLAELQPPSGRAASWLAGGLVALGLGAGLWMVAREPTRCTGADEAIASAWSDSRRARVQAGLADVPRSYAPRIAQWTVERLDTYADDWIDGHRDACEASTVRGEQSPAVMDLRMECLARARRELAATADLLAGGGEDVLDRAEVVVGELRELERCTDVVALSAEVPPPGDPEVAAAVERARGGLAEIDVLLGAVRHDEADTRLATLEAETIDHPPLRTEIALRRGRLEQQRGDFHAAEAAYREVMKAGMQRGQWRESWSAANGLVQVVGVEQGRHDVGIAYAETAAGLVSRLGERALVEQARTRSIHGDLLMMRGELEQAEAEQRAALQLYREARGPDAPGQASILGGLATVLKERGRYEDSEQAMRTAMQMAEASFSPDYPSVLRIRLNLAVLLKSRGRYDEAETMMTEILEATERTLGPDHPSVFKALVNLANVLRAQGRYDEAEAHLRRAIVVAAGSVGPTHIDTAGAHGMLGVVLKSRGDNVEAETELRQAVEITAAALGPDHARTANARGNLANALKNLGRYEEAETELREALVTTRTALGPKHPSTAMMLHNLANLLSVAERSEEAVALFEEAVEIRTQVLGPSHRHLAMSLAGLGAAQLEVDRVDEAVASLERSWAIVGSGGSPRDRARVAFPLARGLWLQGQDRARALQLARSAQQWFSEDAGPEHPETQEVTDWLASRP